MTSTSYPASPSIQAFHLPSSHQELEHMILESQYAPSPQFQATFEQRIMSTLQHALASLFGVRIFQRQMDIPSFVEATHLFIYEKDEAMHKQEYGRDIIHDIDFLKDDSPHRLAMLKVMHICSLLLHPEMMPNRSPQYIQFRQAYLSYSSDWKTLSYPDSMAIILLLGAQELLKDTHPQVANQYSPTSSE